MPFFDPEDPTDEASHWLHFLLRKGRSEIDALFQKGYAEEHPELLAAYLQAGATLMSSKALGSEVGSLSGSLSDISSSLDRIGDNIPSFSTEE